MSQLLGHEAELITALTAAERAALTGILAKLEPRSCGERGRRRAYRSADYPRPGGIRQRAPAV